MKKIIMIILAVIAIFAISTTAFAEDVSEETTDNTVILDISKIGDANGDNNISAADARFVLRISAKLEQTPDEWIYLDINADKKLSAADARILLRISAKLDSIENYSECILHGHDMVKTVIAPTCTVNGYTTNKCSRCSYTDETKDNVQPKTGHSFKKGSVIKGTCVSDGYTEYKCSTCGTVEKRDITKAGGHNYQYVSKEFYQTSNFVGYKATKKCAYCGKVIETYDSRTGNSQIEMKLISSSAAIAIINKFDRPIGLYPLEGYDITGTRVVVYNDVEGLDADGYYYNLDGTRKAPCPFCFKPNGIGKGMCDTSCRLIVGGV